MQTRGRGSKNPKILQTSYVHGPLPFLKIYAVGIRGIFQLITSCSSCFENTFQELGVQGAIFDTVTVQVNSWPKFLYGWYTCCVPATYLLHFRRTFYQMHNIWRRLPGVGLRNLGGGDGLLVQVYTKRTIHHSSLKGRTEWQIFRNFLQFLRIRLGNASYKNNRNMDAVRCRNKIWDHEQYEGVIWQ